MFAFLRSLLQDPRRRALVLCTTGLYATMVVLHLAAGLSSWAALYESMRVFTFDVGYTPDDHGFVAVALWLCRLGAPIITLGIAAEVVDHLGLLQLPMLFFQLFGRDHVVVVGAGRLGRHMAEALRAGGHRVVVIEKDDGADHVAELRRQGIPVVIGDGSSEQTLGVARIARARALVSTTAQDLVNLEVALLARRLSPKVQAYAHVEDDVLRHHLTLTEAIGAYSSYEWIAAELARRAVVKGAVLFIIVGYGRLGRAVLRRLRTEPEARFLVVDPNLSAAITRPHPADSLDTDLGRESAVAWLAEDMLSPALLTRVRKEPDPVVRALLCTDDDEIGRAHV